MTERYHFSEAIWFRAPLKMLIVALTAFAILTLYPALGGTRADNERALFGLAVVAFFAVLASIFAVTVDDSHADLDGDVLRVRFETFFNATIPIADVVRVAPVDARPRWRYSTGLSTNFRERVCCSHGGRLIEVELSKPVTVKLWPRKLEIQRFWLGVREYEAFLVHMRRLAPGAVQVTRTAA